MHVKTAVVGAGFIGPAHVEALRRLGITVSGILGCDQKESESAKACLGLPKAYEDLDEILADDVDAVHLAVPNVLHYPFAKRVIEAGKNVLCEKPLAMNSRETSELVELAKSKGVQAGVSYNLRFYPMNIQAREMVARGDLGNVFAINGCYVQDWLLYDTDYNWRVLAEQGGELRAIGDIGTHWMDVVQWITGLEVESLLADLNTVYPVRKRPKGEVETFSGGAKQPRETEAIDISTEDYGAVLFHFRGGARGSMNVSQINAGRKNCLRYEIAGSKAAVAFDSDSPNELWIGHRERANEQMPRDPSQMTDLARQYTTYPGGHAEGYPDTFKGCFRAFYRSVTGQDEGRPMYPTFADGHREVVLCEAILESHQKRAWVDVGS